jgi:hypothetical protein
MDEIIKNILEGFPSLAALVLVVYILWKQNDRLLAALLSELQQLREELYNLKTVIESFKEPRE